MELQVGEGLHAGSVLLDVAAGQHIQGVGVDHLFHGCQCVAVLRFADGGKLVARVLHFPQTVVETYFCFEAVGTTYPVDGAFHLTVGSGQTALGIGVVFAIYFGDFTGIVLLAAGTCLLYTSDAADE